MNKCLSCGLCCHHAIVPPFTEEELKELDPVLSDPIIRFREHRINPDVHLNDQTGTRICSWFVDGRCSHYELRPQECRDFEVDGEHCRQLTQLLIRGS